MGFLSTLTDSFREQLERRRNRPFLRATMAACALVAAADGRVSLGERVRVDQVLDTLERLRVFDPHEGVDLFNDLTDAILANPKDGHRAAIDALLAGVGGDSEAAELLIRVCLAVSEMSGDDSRLVDEIEIVSLCSRLGVDPRTVGLYSDDSMMARMGANRDTPTG